MSLEKKPLKLCKYMGKCDNYKKNKKCQFSHEKCKFQSNCNKKQICKYFHNENDNESRIQFQTTNIKKIYKKTDQLCKNGDNCKFLIQGTCNYKHNQTKQKQNSSLINQNKQLRVLNEPQLSRQQRTQQNNFIESNLISVNFTTVQPLFIQKLCAKNIASSCVQKNCLLSHSFASNYQIIRIFITRIQNLKNCLIFRHENSTHCILQKENKINFYNIQSANKLLSQNNSAQDQKLMYSMLSTSLDFHQPIQSIHLVQNRQNKCLLCSTPNYFYYYNPVKGEVKRHPYNNTIALGVCSIQNSILILAQGTLIKWQPILDNFASFAPELQHQKLLFLKNKFLCGSEVIAAGAKEGKIYFFDYKAQFKEVILNVEGNVVDCELILYEGVPSCLCILQKPTGSQIYFINLINFTTTLLSMSTEKYKRILQIKGLFYLHVETLGVILFQKDFSRAVGMLCPMSIIENKIDKIDSDGQSTIIIKEEGNCPIFAIYGIRR